MDKALDRIYAETDRDFREVRPSDEEWEWTAVKHAAFRKRITEIEDQLTYGMGPKEFVDLLCRWQKNVHHLLRAIRKRRTDPFAEAT